MDGPRREDQYDFLLVVRCMTEKGDWNKYLVWDFYLGSTKYFWAPHDMESFWIITPCGV